MSAVSVFFFQPGNLRRKNVTAGCRVNQYGERREEARRRGAGRRERDDAAGEKQNDKHRRRRRQDGGKEWRLILPTSRLTFDTPQFHIMQKIALPTFSNSNLCPQTVGEMRKVPPKKVLLAPLFRMSVLNHTSPGNLGELWCPL